MSAQLTVEDVRARIAPVLRRHRVRRAGLFGSLVHGDLRPDSDVDILVELPEGQSLLDLVALKLDLERELGRAADVVEYAALHPLLRTRILEEQVVVA